MQLRTISRRAVDGSLTILGDVAQATGPVVYRALAGARPYLPRVEVTVEELRHAYRVPAEIMELALPLLDRIAPDVEPPLAYRQGGAAAELVQVADGRRCCRRRCARPSELDGLIAVIAPRSLAERARRRRRVRRGGGAGADAAAGEGPRVRPRRRRRAGGDRRGRRRAGLRELYVALTRPTKTLVVVHSTARCRDPDALRDQARSVAGRLRAIRSPDCIIPQPAPLSVIARPASPTTSGAEPCRATCFTGVVGRVSSLSASSRPRSAIASDHANTQTGRGRARRSPSSASARTTSARAATTSRRGP